jgi:hypothetical protein
MYSNKLLKSDTSAIRCSGPGHEAHRSALWPTITPWRHAHGIHITGGAASSAGMGHALGATWGPSLADGQMVMAP